MDADVQSDQRQELFSPIRIAPITALTADAKGYAVALPSAAVVESVEAKVCAWRPQSPTWAFPYSSFFCSQSSVDQMEPRRHCHCPAGPSTQGCQLMTDCCSQSTVIKSEDARDRQNDHSRVFEVSPKTADEHVTCVSDPVTRPTWSIFTDGTRFPHRSEPVIHNSQIIPLVQYFEGPDDVTARIGRAAPNCIYRAQIVGSDEHSIVNACDSDDGLFGMLAFPDGVYSVEPILKEEKVVYGSTRYVQHAAHRIKRQVFHPAMALHSNETTHQEAYDQGLWEDVQMRDRRSRRSANSWDHYVEAMVVADSKMFEYHGYNLEDYVLTLFSSVASIYRHQSLRASVNIVVVKLVILKHESAGPQVTSNAQDTLQRFCRWQALYNDRDESSPSHHDVAILLTRRDICRAPGKCDTLGLAELGTMCDPQKSCAIIEDNGLSAAFTIAHELGHVFNIPHDDERRCSQYMQVTKSNYHIMAPTLEYNTHPWSWSACSSGMLERFLDNNRGQIQCLFDQPIQRKFYEALFESQSAGRKYDVHQQCRFVFGPQSELCPYMPTCRRLWCATYYGNQMGCRTQHMPWADGTPCDQSDRSYCHRGECVGLAPEQRSKIDGGWGEWQPWGPCSRSCGGGIQKALRDCDNPRPSNGGKYCIGQREQYRSCNTQECPWDTTGFREMQCSEFNGKDVGIHGVAVNNNWVPKYTGVANNERCKLYCRISGTAASYLLKDKVTDGTPCERNGDDICVDGTCMTAGCDHVLGSPLKRDKCGICGGDDSTCRVVTGTYNERGSFGYNEVMKIPAGSANIDIRQYGYNGMKEDDNYLSLRASTGEFLLNGHFQVSVFRQQIAISDGVLDYSGSDNVIERINGTGPIRTDIYVHVLSVGNLNPPDIRYEYMTAVDSHVRLRQQSLGFFWRPGERWSDCDRLCQGSQYQDIVCIDATTNRPTNERFCRQRRPQAPTRMCNIECVTKWKTDDVAPCDAHCHNGHGHGEKTQRVACIRTEGNRVSVARETDCDRTTRPSERVACHVDCSGTGKKWVYSEWSQCSVSCGKGVHTRNASCVDSTGRPVPESQCVGAKEPTQQPCVLHPCPRWVYGHWSECSRSCDGGVRMRHAQCMDAADREIDHRHCGSKIDREVCNEKSCTWWSFGDWSQCSATCGDGLQTRHAQCTDRNQRELPDTDCNIRERIVQKPCVRPKCPSWQTGAWSPCSVSCDEGWETRRVSCVNARGDDLALDKCLEGGAEKPASHRQCNQGSCPFWRTGEWTACSASCGTGSRQRSLECVYRQQVVDNSYCGDTSPPSINQACTLVPCSYWQTSSWSACSTSCGTGTQNRDVFCTKGNEREKTMDSYCDKTTRPRDTKVCTRENCETPTSAPIAEVPAIRWAVGPWSQCSAACGRGTQKRLVICRDHVRDLPDRFCEHLEKMEDVQQCELRPCTYWRTGPWMPCPVTCGVHAQQNRVVTCVSRDASYNVSESDCDPAQRPAVVKSCRLQACPKGDPLLGSWSTGSWGQCSNSCDGGWKSRLVTCSTNTCDEEMKPVVFEKCNEELCPPRSNTTWQISPWTHCSVTCGTGVQRRRVWCEDATSLRTQSDSKCEEEKPFDTRPCELPNCDATRPQWQSSAWSACSAKCGRGVRRRHIKCIDGNTNATLDYSRCDPSRRPMEELKCRSGHCPRWRGTPWSTCSTTCGSGVRHREVFCHRGRRQRANDSDCDPNEKPPTESKCIIALCPAYHWKPTPWSKCVDNCQKGQQTRRVYCLSNSGKRAAPRMCSKQPMPPQERSCDLSKCPYEWVPGPWQSCSRTCGTGIQMRSIQCRVKSNNVTTREDEPTVPKERCTVHTLPNETQSCNVTPCDAEFLWNVGPWESCSQTCGQGIRRRRVRCQTREGGRASRDQCEAISARPKRTQTCSLRNCLPATCHEIKGTDGSHTPDGNYTVLLDGFPIQVYCHKMNQTIPGTYINLDPQSNFAEVYGKRLLYPYTCPNNGERNDSCQCTDHGDANAGFTRFHKVRVDLLNRKININDFTFAETMSGQKVAYGTAGDCFSMIECPQGHFQIDLFGTGLKVVDDLLWEDKGHRTFSRLSRTMNNARVEGYCGGYCGKCAPDKYKGLIFEIDPKQLSP